MSIPEEVKFRALELYEGRSAASALRLLRNEFLNKKTVDGRQLYQDMPIEQDMPNEKTIRRWHNKKLLEEHREDLINIAESLIGNLEDVYRRPKRGDDFDIFEYSIMHGDIGQGITHQQLSSYIQYNIETVSEKYQGTGWESFMIHLAAEVPELTPQGLQNYARANPYEFIDILKQFVHNQKLKGRCPTCQHWHN